MKLEPGKWYDLGQLLIEDSIENNNELSKPRLRRIETLMQPGKYEMEDQ